ncbi:MAG: DMT family transporter [Promethearchaeota archaeon]
MIERIKNRSEEKIEINSEDKNLVIESVKNPPHLHSKTAGLIFALVVLIGNGIHPIINNLRPETLDSFNFTFQMSLWEYIFAFFAVIIENKVNRPNISKGFQKPGFFGIKNKTTKLKVFGLILIIGLLFSVATYLYVEGLRRAGAISGSIALKISPVYAFIFGILFLNEKVNWKQLLITAIMLLGVYYIGTDGTFQIEIFSIWFGIMLFVPFLWSIGHTITKRLFHENLLTPNQIILFRTGIISTVMIIWLIFTQGWHSFQSALLTPKYLWFSFLMGTTYFFMHFSWYNSIKKIDFSFASALVTPSPVVTSILAIIFLKDIMHLYQLIGMIWIFLSLYGLILVNKKKKM